MKLDEGPIHTAEGIIGLFFDEDQEGQLNRKEVESQRRDVCEEVPGGNQEPLFGGSLSPA